MYVNIPLFFCYAFTELSFWILAIWFNFFLFHKSISEVNIASPGTLLSKSFGTNDDKINTT